jgi:hypothetical protein
MHLLISGYPHQFGFEKVAASGFEAQFPQIWTGACRGFVDIGKFESCSQASVLFKKAPY